MKKLAEISGLKLDQQSGGLLVDENLRANDSVFVAGDAVAYPQRGEGPSEHRRITNIEDEILSGRITAHVTVVDVVLIDISFRT